MGRSFDDVKKEDGSESSKTQVTVEAKTAAATNTAGFGFFSVADSSSPTSSPSSGAHTSPESDTYAHESVENAAGGYADEDTMSSMNPVEETDNRVVHRAVHVPRGTSVDYISAPWGLVDPLFKDLSQISRFYLYHCMLSPCDLWVSLLTDDIGHRQSTHGQRLCCILSVQEPLARYYLVSRRLAASRTRHMCDERATLLADVGIGLVPDALVFEQPLDQRVTSVS